MPNYLAVSDKTNQVWETAGPQPLRRWGLRPVRNVRVHLQRNVMRSYRSGYTTAQRTREGIQLYFRVMQRLLPSMATLPFNRVSLHRLVCNVGLELRIQPHLRTPIVGGGRCQTRRRLLRRKTQVSNAATQRWSG